MREKKPGEGKGWGGRQIAVLCRPLPVVREERGQGGERPKETQPKEWEREREKGYRRVRQRERQRLRETNSKRQRQRHSHRHTD